MMLFVAVFVQFLLLQNLDASPSVDHEEAPNCGGYLTSPSLCERRRSEFLHQLRVEATIYNEMLERAHQRAQRNEYRRQLPRLLEKKEHAEHYDQIQRLLSKQPSDFAAWKNFSRNSFADLSIVGFPKAGTSHLYKLLDFHPDTEPAFKRKEFCIDHGHFLDYTKEENQMETELYDLQRKLFTYHKHLLKKRTQSDHQHLLVNACLQHHELEYHLAYTPLPESSKFLLVFRDPADWLWASWNFWIDKNMDLPAPIDHDWASAGVHYRSPELFHELILSQNATKSAGKRFRTILNESVHVPRRLLYLLGKDRILFLKNEDMRASTNNDIDPFLTRLADFTTLTKSKFDLKVAHGYTNCNGQKGYRNLCSTSHSAYEITHHRPMLEVTRQLIYIQFREECRVWAEEFGIVYKDCLQAIPRQSPHPTTNKP